MTKRTLGSWLSGCLLLSAGWVLAGCSVDRSEPYQVGDQVPDPEPSNPKGKVTEVTPPTGDQKNSYRLITIEYPPAWSCPAGATNVPGSNPTVQPPRDSALAAKTCGELAALRRPALKAESQQTLNSQRASTLSQKCYGRSETRCVDLQGNQVGSSLCYQSNGHSADAGMAMGGARSGIAISSFSGATPSSSAGGAGGANNSGASEVSTTNTQVATVDEADFVKNDNNTIYVLAADGLHVIDAWPAAETHQAAKIALPGEPRRLFLEKNRLVVYTRMQASNQGGAGTSNPSDQGCTYGYDCRFQSEGGHTMVLVFDVSDPASPKELVRYETSGAFVASRRVGATVYTVVHDTGAPQIPGLSYQIAANSYEEFQAQYETRTQENGRLIDETPDTYFLPWARQTLAAATVVSSGCDRALAADQARGNNFTTLLAFDLDRLEPMTRTVVATSPGYVYASAQALYLAVDQAIEPDYSSTSSYYGSRAENSVVHKFALAGTDTRYLGSAALPGHILNQFAMDEDAGILRVASTKGWVPDPAVASFVTTFKEGDGKLVQLGQLGGIAPTEDIRSVRFDGTRAFVVTFKKTDPLFVFDLSEPASPKMLGELKIPGFSTYMHPLDHDHLLAIGFNADDQGSYAYFNGIQIQIFDVSILSSPTLMWKTSVGTRGSNSEALTNHLAFNYFAPKKLLALPLAICEGGGNGTYGDKLTFAGLMAFDVSLDKGISEHGRLPFVDPAQASGQCNQWWTNSKSLVKRSIFMDDWIYGLTDTQLRVAALSDMTTPLQIVSLGDK